MQLDLQHQCTHLYIIKESVPKSTPHMKRLFSTFLYVRARNNGHNIIHQQQNWEGHTSLPLECTPQTLVSTNSSPSALSVKLGSHRSVPELEFYCIATQQANAHIIPYTSSKVGRVVGSCPSNEHLQLWCLSTPQHQRCRQTSRCVHPQLEFYLLLSMLMHISYTRRGSQVPPTSVPINSSASALSSNFVSRCVHRSVPELAFYRILNILMPTSSTSSIYLGGSQVLVHRMHTPNFQLLYISSVCQTSFRECASIRSPIRILPQTLHGNAYITLQQHTSEGRKSVVHPMHIPNFGVYNCSPSALSNFVPGVSMDPFLRQNFTAYSAC